MIDDMLVFDVFTIYEENAENYISWYSSKIPISDSQGVGPLPSTRCNRSFQQEGAGAEFSLSLVIEKEKKSIVGEKVIEVE